MNDFGALCLITSFSLLIFSIVQTSYGIFRNDPHGIELGRYTLMANFGVVLLAFLVLVVQLVRTDLNNYYVVMHSSEHLPLFYKMTSVWSGSSGSLLFWNLLLSFFTFIVLWQTRHLVNDRVPVMNLSLSVIACFFSFLAIFFPDAQPFREFQPAAVAGRGLNPLLQHWAMIIHPPILYVGYVSFAIPFSIATSALITGKLSENWFRFVRRWSIFSWFFLGTGILLGSKWAYEELGWGGYWAWDPVENASLMPWLLSTAFLHSMIIQERRGMLKFWNMFLIILAFHFCLLGTWITRSGVLEGPHSFSKSTIGTPFIIYIGLSFSVYIGFLIYRRGKLVPERNLEAMTSKEGSFLLNNFLLVIATLSILLGVFSPLLYGREFKAPWFNSWGVPSGILLLLLMGSAPLLAWRKGADKIFFTTLFKPLIAGILGAGAYIFYYSRNYSISDYSLGDVLGEVYSVLTIGLGVFTIAGIAQEYHKGIMARKASYPKEGYLTAGVRMLLKNKRRYGGYLVHLSMVILFIGLAGNAFKQNTSVKFFYFLELPRANEIVYSSQDTAVLGDYIIAASSLKIKPIINGDPSEGISHRNVIVSHEATFEVKRQLKEFATMVTERRFYPQISHLSGDFETHIPTSEPSIASTPKEDLYIQLGAIEHADLSDENPDLPRLFMNFFFTRDSNIKSEQYLRFPRQIVANLEVWINPMVKFIWAGSLLFFLSGLLILLPIGENRL
ncbi:cytochrome c assembly protein [Leptospira inadai serovar Lyme str. 10]|uniref:Cytochrome c assembly protein n=2 Tax=Leptospira inadai serovar Lyme TaxID=293084 RepID=V6HAZ8_9LEPT|nr:cytochrome c biogenesis protein CcsA [Leptospira inadai]EQA36472.1 cytochrome c assembly protein [Leptospira inadai serovar Lyme str. 10]PNV74509.1 cytochrome C biogenesis protein [Leptospira inadai serovar Lyme]